MIKDNELKKILVNPGYIEEKDFEKALLRTGGGYKKISKFLVDRALIKDEEINLLIAQFKAYSFVNLRKEKIDLKILNLIDVDIAKKFLVILFGKKNNKIKAGFVNPDDIENIHNLEKLLKKEIEVYYISERDFEESIILYKKDIRERFKELFREIRNEKNTSKISQINTKIIDILLEYAYFSKASDLHIEPFREKIVVRFRIDGVMHEIVEIPKKYLDSILSRVKILSKLRTDEHFAAQDGSFEINIGSDIVDLRVSIIPITSGEKIVMRLLASGNRQKKLSNLGLSGDDLSKLKRHIKSPHGLILVTGPTGSGKTTTIYELLKILNTEEVNISTIEDPVEYDIERVNQIQVNKKTNLSFASGLRAIVRQDPDIIMVGEIRDSETAEIAINSAMTGHLVLSTMHSNDASTTLPRLNDMKIETFLIASTLNIIISQRLVRKICEKCRVSYTVSAEEKKLINSNKALSAAIKGKGKNISSLTFYKGSGCKVCTNTGYKGRTGVFEILEIDDSIRELIIKKSSSEEIKKQARTNGMKTIMEDGVDKVLSGETSFEEILSLIRD